MSQRVIRISELASTKNKPGLLPVSPATIWRWAADPSVNFPAPFKLGPNCTVFDLDQVEAFIAKQADAAQEVSA
jgi:prophage regulatory protein